MNYPQAVKMYISSCRASGLAETTVGNYFQALKLFAATLPASTQEIKTIHVTAWKNLLHQRKAQPSTARAYLRALYLFFEWAVENGLAESNPCTATAIKVKVAPKGAYANLLQREQVLSLLSQERPKGATRATFPRNHALAVLLVTSGVRNSELRALSPADLDFEQGTMLIRCGKGNKSRFAAFVPVAQQAVREYLASSLRPSDLPDDAPLFGHGETVAEWHPLERSELSNLMKRYTALYTEGEGVRTHALRHSSASFMWDSGMSVDDIQGLLGHSDTKTTQIYLDRLRPEAPAQRAASVFAAVQ